MKLVRYRQFGPPESVLEVADVPTPEAGEGEVRIRLEAAPIHLADLKHIRGVAWFDQYAPPHTPGYEGVGRISAVGRGVDGWRIGERAFLPIRFGAWAEEVVAPAQGLWRAPEGLPAEQLALVPINFSTAWLMLKHVPLQRGDWVIQNAANSNVGYYVIRLCRRWGVHTINVVRRAELLPRLAAQGGDVNLVDGDDLAERVRAQIGAAPIRLAFDAVAADAPTRLGRCFGRDGGTILNYGFLSGEPCRIPGEMLMLHGVTLAGFFTARAVREIGPAAVAEMRAEIDRCLAEDPPQTAIAARYALPDVHAAVAHAARVGAAREGKIILVA